MRPYPEDQEAMALCLGGCADGEWRKVNQTGWACFHARPLVVFEIVLDVKNITSEIRASYYRLEVLTGQYEGIRHRWYFWVERTIEERDWIPALMRGYRQPKE